MQKLLLAALTGSTLLASVPALADSQCAPSPPAPLTAGAEGDGAAPVTRATASAPPVPRTLDAPFAAKPLDPAVRTSDQVPPSLSGPQPPGSSTAAALPAERAAAVGLHELSLGETDRIPGLKPIVAAGGRIFVMGQVGDSPDLVAFKDHNFQFVSPMADPRFVCRGMVSDDQGNNVSLADAAKVPGLIAPADRPVLHEIATPAEAVATIAKAAYGSLGPATARPVWVMVDPLCPHSQDTVRALIPYAQAGEIRLNILPVDAFGEVSSHAVHVLVSGAPDHMIQDWFQPGLLQSGDARPSPDSEARFQANHMVFAGLMDGPMHVTGVPEVLWTARDGQVHAQEGLDPPNVPGFVKGLED